MVLDQLDNLVVHDGVMDTGDGIIGVAGVVDTRALYHEEVARGRAVAHTGSSSSESIESCLHHLKKGWLVLVASAVNFILEIAVVEKTDEGEFEIIAGAKLGIVLVAVLSDRPALLLGEAE